MSYKVRAANKDVAEGATTDDEGVFGGAKADVLDAARAQAITEALNLMVCFSIVLNKN